MRTWTRADRPTLCGGPHDQPLVIAIGEPVFVITIPAIARPKYRCVNCVGEAAPELPAYVERVVPLKPMTPIRALKLPMDFKKRASGE